MNVFHAIDKIMEDWEKAYTNEGVQYYINHKLEKTQWDHPFFQKILDDFEELNAICYAAYRTATKLQYLRKAINLHHVSITTIADTVKSLSLSAVLSVQDLTELVTSLFKRSRREGYRSFDLELSVECVVNLILNTFDPDRGGRVALRSVLTVLYSLCESQLTKKYTEYFKLVRNDGGTVEREQLTQFVDDLLQLLDTLGESTPFGKSSSAVNSCFTMVKETDDVTEEGFVTWLLQEPQTVVWLPTLHRLAAAEKVKHEVRCGVCGLAPLVGFRYRCLKCLSYDLCQDCFFTGRVSGAHKLSHPVQEYCKQTTSVENTKTLMRIVRNKLSGKKRRKLRYLPVDEPEQFQTTLTEKRSDLPSDYLESFPLQTLKVKSSQTLSQGHNDRATQMSPYPDSQPTRPVTVRDEAVQTKPEVTSRDPLTYRSRDVSAESVPLGPAPPYKNWDRNQNTVEGADVIMQHQDDIVELSNVVHILEDENKALLEEIARFRTEDSPSSVSEDSDLERDLDPRSSAEREARDLERARLEVMEAHNQQLSQQLGRLRNLLLRQQQRQREPLESRLSKLSHRSGGPYTTYRSPPTFTADLSRDTDHDLTATFDLTGVTEGLGRTYCSLPRDDVTATHAQEEEEMRAMVERLNRLNDSSAEHSAELSRLNAVYEAAYNMDAALSQFVGKEKLI